MSSDFEKVSGGLGSLYCCVVRRTHDDNWGETSFPLVSNLLNSVNWLQCVEDYRSR